MPRGCWGRGGARALFAAAVAAGAVGLSGPRQAAAADCDAVRPCAVSGAAAGRYYVATPNGAGPHPTVMFLHGWGGSGQAQMRNRGLVRAILARGYAVIAPHGQPRGGGRNGARWNAFARGDMRDDVRFLRAVADDAAKRFPLARGRMLLAGFSGGGMMAWRVACDAPDSFAAYAPVAGLLWRPLPDKCSGPVRLLHTHGFSDPVVPFEGRVVAGGRLQQGDLFRGLDLLRRANRCRKDMPDDFAIGDRFWRRTWTACAPGSALELALHKGGHSTPPGWSTLAIDWFERQKL